MAEASATPLLPVTSVSATCSVPVVGASASCLLPVTSASAICTIPVKYYKKYYNDRQEVSCPFAYAGDSIVVEANTLYSIVSKADANAQALALAESQLVCTLIPQLAIRKPYKFLYTSDGRMFVFGYGLVESVEVGQLHEVGETGLHKIVLQGYQISDIIEASDGNYYFTSQDAGTITKLTPDLVVSTLASGLSYCKGICQGPDGALYTGPATNGDKNVWRITLSGEKSVYLTTPDNYNHFPIIPASDSKLYFNSYYYGSSQIYRINGVGSVTSGPRTGFDKSNVVSFFESPDGLFYSAAFVSGLIFSINKSFVYTDIATIPVSTPYGSVYLYEGANGVLYVTTNGNPTARLFSVTKAGVVTLLHTWTNEGIYDIFGGVVGFDDDLFFGGWSANKVWRYSLSTGLVTAFTT